MHCDDPSVSDLVLSACVSWARFLLYKEIGSKFVCNFLSQTNTYTWTDLFDYVASLFIRGNKPVIRYSVQSTKSCESISRYMQMALYLLELKKATPMGFIWSFGFFKGPTCCVLEFLWVFLFIRIFIDLRFWKCNYNETFHY